MNDKELIVAVRQLRSEFETWVSMFSEAVDDAEASQRYYAEQASIYGNAYECALRLAKSRGIDMERIFESKEVRM